MKYTGLKKNIKRVSDVELKKRHDFIESLSQNFKYSTTEQRRPGTNYYTEPCTSQSALKRTDTPSTSFSSSESESEFNPTSCQVNQKQKNRLTQKIYRKIWHLSLIVLK